MDKPGTRTTAGITRRTALGYAAAVPLIASTAAPRGRTRAAASPVRLSLPLPTGPDPVGTASVYLADETRTDPWVPSRPRELMIQLWYPAAAGGGARAAYMPPGAARRFAATMSGMLSETVSAESVLALRTCARPGGEPRGGERPVILFSPGEGLDRSSATAIVTDLASYGFTVVGIDHTHDSGEVEFPGGLVETSMLQVSDPAAAAMAVGVRVADVRFVLDRLAQLGPGRVGMVGHSLGGAAAAQAMLADPRIRAGANLDGEILGTVATAGLDRPFLLAGSALRKAGDPSWHQLWQNLRGWRQDIVLSGSGHLSFTDIELWAGGGGPLDASASMPPKSYLGTFGSIVPARSVLIGRRYLRSFFDRFLRDRDDGLLDGPSADFPEVIFGHP